MLGCADSAEEHVVERASILLSPEGGASKRTVTRLVNQGHDAENVPLTCR